MEAEQPKNYYWSTVERDGVRHNTLKYSRRPASQPASQVTEPAVVQSSPGEIWQHNCCTFLLIFIIFVLTVLLMLALLRSYHLEQRPLKNINYKSGDLSSRNTVVPTEKSFTFFPF